MTEKKKPRRNRRFGKRKQRSTTVCSDEIPFGQWVHIAGIYDGTTLKIVVNCDMQQDQKQLSGDISIKGFAPLFLGGQRLFAKLEETEQTAQVGQLLRQEVVTRQYVDGRGIDEHLQTVNEAKKTLRKIIK